MTDDAVRSYLEARGCAHHLCEEGLGGLVARWEAFVEEVCTGYELGLDDYLNDLDLRDILEGALAVARGAEAKEIHRRAAAADERFKEATTECPCLWGPSREAEHPVRWWTCRRPRHPSPELLSDLNRAGL